MPVEACNCSRKIKAKPVAGPGNELAKVKYLTFPLRKYMPDTEFLHDISLKCRQIQSLYSFIDEKIIAGIQGTRNLGNLREVYDT